MVTSMLDALPLDSTDQQREDHYEAVAEHIKTILEGEDDWVAVMATVACELHHAFEYYDWTGFYRRVGPEKLTVGPYQGTHGCLHIEFERGVCGAAARTKKTQLVPNVHDFPGHIACSTTTQSEIVVPVLDATSDVLAVLDVDSDAPAAFREVDQRWLEELCEWLGKRPRN
jgi:GAF domain-containing protein